MASFANAIELAWFLKIDYMWIDSLYIIQGDSEDWKREDSRMEKVYRNSYCNIAAADAKDSTNGLFRTRQPRNVIPPHFEIPEESATFGTQRWNVLRGDLWENGLLTKPLYTRGWVYQERMLAPRILHFSSHQIFWDCISLSACETVPSGLPLPLDQQSSMDRHWRERLQGSTRGTKLLSGVSGESIDELWRAAVKAYTGLDLTHQSDKRMAIWGVATRIRDMINEGYVAGMWEGAVEEQLGWRVADGAGAERPRDLQGAPTWSWMSVKGTVLVPDRTRQWRRSWIVGDHAGQRLSLDIEDRGRRSGGPGKPGESVAQMRRAMEVAHEKRRRSSVAVPRPMADVDSGMGPVHSSQEYEPELRSKKLAIQACIQQGTLQSNSPSGIWTFHIPTIPEQTTDIVAYPDVQVKGGEYAFIVLALTLRPDWESEEIMDGETWYDGHGLMLEKAEAKYCFRRVGALDIRHLSCRVWRDLRAMSESFLDAREGCEEAGYMKLFLE